MVPVMEEADQVQVEEPQPEHPLPTGEEISRAARQRRLELSAKDCKHKLTRDVNTVTQMLTEYQAEFPEDDLTCEIQLREANDIIKVFERAGDRWEAVETVLDLKSCIFSSLTLTDIDVQIERVDAAMVEYAAKFEKVKKEKKGYFEKM